MTVLPRLATDGSVLLPLTFSVGFVYVSLVFGRRIMHWLGARAGSVAERGVIAICIGAGILQFVPFALGVAGVLNVTSLRIAVAVAVALALPDVRVIVRRLSSWMHETRHPEAWLVAWALALAPAALMAAWIALTPSLDPDGLAYHLTVPKRWMATGHLDYLPTYPYSNAPMGMELLFGWAMALGGDAAAKCIHFVLGMLAVAAVYLAGKRLRNPMTGAVCASLYLVGPAGVAAVLGFSYVEGGAALATAAAALAWLIWLQSDSRGVLRVAALLAGIGVTFKISAVFFPVALGALSVLAMEERSREAAQARPWSSAVAAMSGLVPLAAIPVLPWLARALVLTGNPFFPLLANLIPSRDLSADLATQVDRYNRYMTWGNSVGRSWSLEQRTHLLLAAGAVLLLVGLVIAFRQRTRLTRGAVLIVTVTALAQLLAAGLYLRYWIPLAAALMLPVVALFGGWLARRPIAYLWVAITLLFSLLMARGIYYGAGGDLKGLASALGGPEQRLAFLQQRLPLYPLYERANRDLPAGAGIMLSAYCGGFYIDRKTFCAEMVQQSLRFTSWEDFSADLRRLGITHIIAPSVLANGGPTPDLGGSSVSAITRGQQFERLRVLLTQHSRMLQTASDQGLYEIDPGWLAQQASARSP